MNFFINWYYQSHCGKQFFGVPWWSRSSGQRQDLGSNKTKTFVADSGPVCLQGLQTTKAQTALRIDTVWSLPILFAYWKVPYRKLLASLWELRELTRVSLCQNPLKQVLPSWGSYTYCVIWWTGYEVEQVGHSYTKGELLMGLTECTLSEQTLFFLFWDWNLHSCCNIRPYMN